MRELRKALKQFASFSALLAYLLLLSIFSSTVTAFSTLYPGEKRLTTNNIQTLTKFIKGEPNKPLIIFVPGNSHLARISYGYPKDFISYWLHEKGYSFLGISYPLDNPVYTQAYPAFSIREWGIQVAEVARLIINENKLTNHIVILGLEYGWLD